jgi:AAA15 family ATPase/GTPase
LEAIEKYYQLKPRADKKIIPVRFGLLFSNKRDEMFRYMINVREKEAEIKINNAKLKFYVDDILFEREIRDFFEDLLKMEIEKEKWDTLIQELKTYDPDYNKYYIFGKTPRYKSLFIHDMILLELLYKLRKEKMIKFINFDSIIKEIFKTDKIQPELILSPIRLKKFLYKLESAKLEEDVKIKLDVERTIKKYEIEKIERFQDQFFIFKDGSAVPLDILGDGFLQMIGAIYYLAKCKEIALLDEPTAFMHPGYIRKFVEYLIDVVKDKNLQVFISTHNIDLLETFLDFGEDDSFVKDNLKIIRLTRVNGDIRARELSFKEALEESEELYTDLRGI